jgi:CheY-like chemotaxis protein
MPIIALTAGALTDEREECFEAGMNDFLSKPMNADAIPRVLNRWAKRSRRG